MSLLSAMLPLALLSSGPSVARTWCAEMEAGCSTVVALNHAALHFPSDWVVFFDAPMAGALQASGALRPRVGYVTRPNYFSDLAPRASRLAPLPWHGESAHARLAADPRAREAAGKTGMAVCSFTFPNALRFARDLCGDQAPIHVHGFDCAVEVDSFRGAGDGPVHGIERWVLELPWIRAAWGPTCVQLGEASAAVMDYVAGRRPGPTLPLFPPGQLRRWFPLAAG